MIRTDKAQGYVRTAGTGWTVDQADSAAASPQTLQQPGDRLSHGALAINLIHYLACARHCLPRSIRTTRPRHARGSDVRDIKGPAQRKARTHMQEQIYTAVCMYSTNNGVQEIHLFLNLDPALASTAFDVCRHPKINSRLPASKHVRLLL